MVNYYQILGLGNDASNGEIKAAFKQLAIKYHPDKNPEDPTAEERFKEINRAYQVLSNPYEKARHDLQMKYGAFHQETFYHEPEPPPRYRPPDARPYNYAEREINWRENWIATAYAFGFTFIVAIVVMSVIGIKGYYDEKKFEALLAERRAHYDQAVKMHAVGNLDDTFVILNSLGGFLEREEDMFLFKKRLVDEVISKSHYHFERSEYADAIYYYELIENHTTNSNLTNKENLAISYKEVNQPKKSIEVLTRLLILGYRNLFTYVELAKIHRDHLNDTTKALTYFERANDVAKEYYKSIYGEAYPIVLNNKNLTEVHWELYDGLAKLYLATDDLDKAVKCTKWNIRVWPDRTSSYLIAAEALEKMGNINEACMQYGIARTFDPNLEVRDICL